MREMIVLRIEGFLEEFNNRSVFDAGKRDEVSFKCVVTGDQKPKSKMIRFVVGPAGEIVPDLQERLPGDAVWITSNRKVIDELHSSLAFLNIKGLTLGVPGNFSEHLETLLVRRCLSYLGIARRSGQVLFGMEKVLRFYKEGKEGVLLIAKDASCSGRKKLRSISKFSKELSLFNSDELGAALGRESLTYNVIKEGSLARKLIAESIRLEGFRQREVVN